MVKDAGHYDFLVVGFLYIVSLDVCQRPLIVDAECIGGAWHFVLYSSNPRFMALYDTQISLHI